MSIRDYIPEIQQRYQIGEVRHVFELRPCPAPRMTRSDQWRVDPYHPDPKKRQRPEVARYFAFKTEFIYACNQQGYFLEEVLNVVIVVAMPESWSKKKKVEMFLAPHQQRPDRDNYLKAIQDAFKTVDDGYVYDGRTLKVWGYEEGILIY